ncbi:MAG: iron export ABC transporter permease subunit FetB [bacterium]
MDEIIHIGPWSVAGAAALIIANAVVSFWLRLGMEKKILVGAVRAVIQLILLGYLLVPVFHFKHWGFVLGIALVMVIVAARESVRRSKRTYKGAWWDMFVTLALATSVTSLFGTAVLVGVDPWWTPRYFIPLLGMLLGNVLNGITIGLDATLRELDEGRSRIEGRLAFGATWWEACQPAVAEAVRLAMMPTLNMMNVVGIVSIPGMMTGQLLGGTDPEIAARYQILILFMIAATVAVGTVASAIVSARRLFDDEHRLRLERLDP